MTAHVVAQDLVKRFGDFTAVDGISFQVAPGEAFGFLGPNGAGKSSTMRMIAATSSPSDGYLRVLGMDPRTEGPQIRARLGVVAQDDNLDRDLRLTDNLLVYARYFGISWDEARIRAAELLEFVELTARADAKIDSLSGGMRRRVVIARALMSRPDLVLLDEPTTGLDPQARQLVWDRLYRLKQRGVSLLLTTHYMDEAEQLCDRLVVIDEGRIVAEGSPAQLVAAHVSREVVELRFRAEESLPDIAGRLDGVGSHTEVLRDRIVLASDDAPATLRAIESRDVVPATTLVRRATLEDVFITLTGRSLTEV